MATIFQEGEVTVGPRPTVAVFLVVVLLCTTLAGCADPGRPYAPPRTADSARQETTATPISSPTPAISPPPRYSPTPPTYAPTPAPPTPAPRSPTPQSNSADACGVTEVDSTDPQAVGDYDALHFSWDYGGSTWTWDPLIPKEWWDFYASRDRPTNPSDYGVLTTDPNDKPVIKQIVCILKDAAQAGGFQDAETVEMTVSFVQSLKYVSDKAGTGYDDYPKYPLETLVDQGGDCEDSSILLATLLQGLGYDTVLLLFPHVNDKPNVGHMAVGIYGKDIPGTYWEYNSRRYYYIEATNSGWEIGQVPDIVKGQSANVLTLTPRAILAGLTWTAPTYEAGYYKLDIHFKNTGTETATNVAAWAGWDAGGTRAWNGQTWSDGSTLGPDQEMVVTMYLKPPPRGEYTRSWVAVWASNAVKVQAYSPYFTS